jgi:hypothetical protein
MTSACPIDTTKTPHTLDFRLLSRTVNILRAAGIQSHRSPNTGLIQQCHPCRALCKSGLQSLILDQQVEWKSTLECRVNGCLCYLHDSIGP